MLTAQALGRSDIKCQRMCKQASGGRRKAGILGQRVDGWQVAKRNSGFLKLKKRVFFHGVFFIAWLTLGNSKSGRSWHACPQGLRSEGFSCRKVHRNQKSGSSLGSSAVCAPAKMWPVAPGFRDLGVCFELFFPFDDSGFGCATHILSSNCFLLLFSERHRRHLPA